MRSALSSCPPLVRRSRVPIWSIRACRRHQRSILPRHQGPPRSGILGTRTFLQWPLLSSLAFRLASHASGPGRSDADGVARVGAGSQTSGVGVAASVVGIAAPAVVSAAAAAFAAVDAVVVARPAAFGGREEEVGSFCCRRPYRAIV